MGFADYARRIGVDIDNLLVSQPDTGEQALEIDRVKIQVEIEEMGEGYYKRRIDRRAASSPARRSSTASTSPTRALTSTSRSPIALFHPPHRPEPPLTHPGELTHPPTL